MSTRPDLAALIEQLAREMRDLSARVGMLEIQVGGLAPRITFLESTPLTGGAHEPTQ
jgi:hypothetical protein